MRKSKAIRLFLCIFILCFGVFLGQASASGPWTVYFNDSPSKLAVVETDSGPVVAVNFQVPAEGDSAEYGIKLLRDYKSGKIHIHRVRKVEPVRGPGDCVKCDGSEKCQDCYPVGSGDSTSGDACWTCNATGDCSYCEGSGVCYTCDGNGFESGCNTCGATGG